MSIQLSIVTPAGEVFSEPVDTVVLPGSEGDFGVLEGHERFLSALRTGALAIQLGGTTRWAAVSQGFADVSGEDVVVLVDRCQLGDQIDAAVVEADRAGAQTSLGELSAESASNSAANSADAKNELRRRELEQVIERADVWLEVARKG